MTQGSGRLTAIDGREFDLLVVGGGITGAAVARDAVLRGLEVLLVDQADFAAGASSASSKLIHGGLRYLRSFRFGLVRESLRERELLLRLVPRFVKPLELVIPVRERARPGRLMMGAGLWLYDLLAGARRIRRHGWLDRTGILEAVPSLRPEKLRGGYRFWDAQMDDARLCLATILDGESRGLTALNYVRLDTLERAGLTGQTVRCTDVQDGHTVRVRCRYLVNATGAWADRTLERLDGGGRPVVRPTKGVHLVVDGLPLPCGVLNFTGHGNRVLFLLPWKGRTLVGTTDTDYPGDPDDVRAEPADQAYLLDRMADIITPATMARVRICSIFAGLRPLISRPGVPEWRVSREHRLLDRPPGGITVVGGKYTTFRAMAAEVIDHLGGNGIPDCTTAEEPAAAGIPPELLAVDQVREMPDAEADVATDACFEALGYALRHEHIFHLDDFLLRRTSLGRTHDLDDSLITILLDEMAAFHGWDAARRAAEAERWQQVRAVIVPEWLNEHEVNG